MRDGVLNTGFLEAEWLLNEWTGFGERKKIQSMPDIQITELVVTAFLSLTNIPLVSL